MTKQEFNKQARAILKLYNATSKDGEVYYTFTPFGVIRISLSADGRNKLYSVFMRFMDDFDINLFYRYFSRHESINRFSKKWNLHNSDPDYILNELDERLNNLTYILKRDGLCKSTEPKPFLNEIETA